MKKIKKVQLIVPFMSFLLLLCAGCDDVDVDDKKIGVIYVVHGGMDVVKPQYMFDAAVHQFSYNHNHAIYNFIIWNPLFWNTVLDGDATEFAKRFLVMYKFGYDRMGGRDPYMDIVDQQVIDMQAALDNNTLGLEFEVDWAGYMAADAVDHYAYPRFIYNVPNFLNGFPPLMGFSKHTYCGENEPDGPWEDCDPERYNVDGPVERLLKKGVSKIIAVDTTTCGVRFSKSFDVIEMTKKALENWNAAHCTDIPLVWVNDPNDLMIKSYPTEPKRWTNSSDDPTTDANVPLDNSNPIANDPDLALMLTEGIEVAFSDTVSDNDTGVILFNHAIHDYNEYFDPKIDDTLILNENIKSLLIERHPGIDTDNIIGAFGGIKKINPENDLEERVRDQRGETYGYAWLYQSDKQFPDKPWGYRYWDACEYLIDQGVKHIVIGFPQMIADNNLNLIEVPNQFGKELGIKTWAKYEEGDFTLYPEVGHPFADHWGVWVDEKCEDSDGGGQLDCCFVMGGCPDNGTYADNGTYPPLRQTAFDKKRNDLDPSLAYDMSEYGHLGYDPEQGAPDHNGPVQDQYTGTWDMYRPPNDDPRIVTMLVRHVLDAVKDNSTAGRTVQ